LGQLRTIHEKLVELGYQMIAVSPDRPEVVKNIQERTDVEYTLLSDSKLQVARAFGVAYQVDDETFSTLMSYDLDIEAASGETHHWLPVPSVFILGTDRKIRFEYVNPEYKVRIDGDVLLAAAAASLD
jgi:peroxiredoxin